MFEIVVRELRATFLGKHARLGLCLRQLSYGLSDSLSDNTTDNSTTTEEPTHDRETRAGDEATDRSAHQLLGYSNARTACACQPLRSLRGDNRTISRLLRHTSSHRR